MSDNEKDNEGNPAHHHHGTLEPDADVVPDEEEFVVDPIHRAAPAVKGERRHMLDRAAHVGTAPGARVAMASATSSALASPSS